MVKENLKDVEQRVLAACESAKRDRNDVTLIAVSKTKPVSMIEECYAEGTRDFGENKPQEMRDKFDELPKDIKWHMIGHLQKNKIKYVIERACLIHSVDSIELAQAISKEAVKRGVDMPVLIEVNVAGEESKFGVSVEETEALVRQIAPLPGIHVQGLMTIAPYTDDPETNRPYFKALKNLSIDIGSKNIDNTSMIDLSMGMTGDYEVAIEEGATLVRVGTGIFGERDYNIPVNDI